MIPDFAELYDRPIIILAAPRSGSTLLFETLVEARDIWSIGGESHGIIEGVKALNPNFSLVDSNRLTEAHASDAIVRLMRRRFARLLRDRDGREFIHHTDIRQLRFIEKTPKNALRVPFMEKVFPGALYIFLFRDVRANLSSMMEAWRARRWITYPKLPGWKGPPWSLLLPPGWQNLNGAAPIASCSRICKKFRGSAGQRSTTSRCWTSHRRPSKHCVDLPVWKQMSVCSAGYKNRCLCRAIHTPGRQRTNGARTGVK
jgi:hypothetical protein